jgi:cytochrome oxidase assembly protein ShyY1
MGLFTWLGFWQLGVAHDSARAEMVERAENSPVVPIDTLLRPHGAFPGLDSSRRVSAVGRYDAAGQFVVPNRRLSGVAGSWVVTPLVVETTGARLAVLRGFMEGTAAPAPTSGDTAVTVVGSIAPGESPLELPGQPAGQLGAVDLGHLANVWPGQLYNAFVFAISETPSATVVGSTPGSLQRVPPPSPDPGMTPRNTAYAVQWWIFALFALWMWWRMVKDAHQREVAAAAEPTTDEESTT